jgi:plastocyanin
MKHLRLCLAVLLVAFAAPVSGQSTIVRVDLTNFRFTPAQLEMKANVPTMLELRNQSSGGHSFAAPAFFAAAHVAPASAGRIRDGRVEVPAHGTVRLALTPVAGNYPLKCGHLFHSALGMKGRILVR